MRREHVSKKFPCPGFLKLFSLVVLSLATVVCTTKAAGPPCHFEIFGDLNNDCVVNFLDLTLIADDWLIDCLVTPENPHCTAMDIDGDGFNAIDDCDDDNAAINPAAVENCDDIDNNCDGTVDEGCKGKGGCESEGCHQGIENIGVTNMRNFQCVKCHKGDDAAFGKDAAHTGMYANPSDLRVIDETCAQCHAPIVEKVKKSLHATMAGMISGTRWTWGAQDTKNAIFATYDINDTDGDVPTGSGALPSLQKIHQYDPCLLEDYNNTPADDYLRNQCLRCHVWSGGHERAGDYRASGCAACHMVYDDDGIYKGSDQAILAYQQNPYRKRKGFPRIHQLPIKIPEFQCIHCHNRGGRTGVSFIGTMESDGYGSPWTDSGGKQGQLHGKHYNHFTADIHFQRGMVCIDCHTVQDLHGDGNIYSKKELAVEIECTDCHGTLEAESTLTTSQGNAFTNLERLGNGTVVLTSKIDGSEHVVPQIATATLSPDGETAMRGVWNHLHDDPNDANDRVLECYACHARWTPQCYGCHAKQDLGKTGRDWIDPAPHPTDPTRTARKAAADASQIAYGWAETRSYLRMETPVLGINSDSEGNKVAPYIPGCQVFFTQIAANGNATVHNHAYTAADGYSGIAHNPIQPHTISDKPRTCENCHATTKARGLGTGIYDPNANLLPINFELERIVDEFGNQIQTTSHVGTRPFNYNEQQRMQMDTTCVMCHASGIPAP
jgi:hypothetical protein